MAHSFQTLDESGSRGPVAEMATDVGTCPFAKHSAGFWVVNEATHGIGGDLNVGICPNLSLPIGITSCLEWLQRKAHEVGIGLAHEGEIS